MFQLRLSGRRNSAGSKLMEFFPEPDIDVASRQTAAILQASSSAQPGGYRAGLVLNKSISNYCSMRQFYLRVPLTAILSLISCSSNFIRSFSIVANKWLQDTSEKWKSKVKKSKTFTNCNETVANGDIRHST